MSASLLILAPTAEANWGSNINSASTGFESRRWSDESFSEVRFKNCFTQTETTKSTDVQIWRDINNLPDKAFDSKTYTACFNGDAVSSGKWNDLPSGEYYFAIDKIGGREGGLLDVGTVYVDTALAD
ncbi:hypothetical protein ACIO1C_17905 [Streptomyces sp. NPDC087420]|uniref:hypothetical protein n=1 Tax=Streptomyces sp. NPDC087420 TaxID=3365785 RepID=UPI003832EE8B